MQELIKVTTDAQGARVVSARELYEFLGISERFSRWIDRMLEYGFEEGVDYNLYQKVHIQIEGFREVAREIEDYILTLDMAKEIAMLQRSYKGKQARRYFIACEAAVRSLLRRDDKIEGLPVAVRFFDGFGRDGEPWRCVLLSNNEVWYRLGDLVSRPERAARWLGWGCVLLLNDTGRKTWYVSKAGWALLDRRAASGTLSLFEKGGDAL